MFSRILKGSLFFILGFAACYFLQSTFNIGAVQASAFSTLSILFLILPFKIKLQAHHEGLLLAGSFAGMTKNSLNSHLIDAIFITFFSLLLFFVLEKYFQKIGGKLGLVVFLSCNLLFLFKEYF